MASPPRPKIDFTVPAAVRTLGYVDGEPRWYEGELLEAEEAAARYQELTGLGGYYPKDPVLLSWRDPTLLAMQVFPVEPNADKTVEYTLTMPAAWQNGRWRIELPALGSATMPAEATLDPGQTLDQLLVDGEYVARHHWLDLSSPAVIELSPREPEPIQMALASVDTGEQRHLVEFEVSLATISETPRKARIVVVLDLSRSLRSGIDGQRTAAMGYLEHFRDPALAAEVAVIGFDRSIHELSGGFVDVEQAIAMLSTATLTSRNGSDVDAALRRASELLVEHASARAPRRIVLMTDFRTASRIEPEALEDAVDRSKAIVHLAEFRPWRNTSLSRDDTHPWASLATRTEGVLWEASAGDPTEPEDLVAAREQFEEWARPVRIDDFRVAVTGLSTTEPTVFGFPDSLAEGEGVAFLGLSLDPTRELQVIGKTWNRRFHAATRPSDAHGDLWSALVFGSELLDELSEAEMMVLAMRGRAVSPVTSYLAIEPGVRPSTEGLEAWERASGRGFGSRTKRVPMVYTAKAEPDFDHGAWLAERLDEARRRCGAADRAMIITLETTKDEIVEVAIASAGLEADTDTCIRQSLWSLEPTSEFDRKDFETWRFDR